LGKGSKPGLFFHPEGKYDPTDDRIVWLENDRGDLYQIKEDTKTGLPHRDVRRRDIEKFYDLTKEERYRR
jgi:hypothetical protein